MPYMLKTVYFAVCPAGTEITIGGPCIPCQEGWFNPAVEAECQMCVNGTTSNADRTECNGMLVVRSCSRVANILKIPSGRKG